MDSLVLINIINKIPLFQNLNERQAHKLIQLCSQVDLNPHDVLMKEGALEQEMYVLLNGTLKVTLREKGIVAAIITNTGVVGEMEVLLNQLCFASVIADAPSKLLKISKSNLELLFSEDMHMELTIYKNLSKILCEKIASSNTRLQHYSKDMDPVKL